MSTTVYGLSCFVVVIGVSSVASADPDYYHAFASADAAVKASDCPLALRAIETALRNYPHDYALTLKLAWVEFQCEDFAAAERTYRVASDLSDQGIEPRVGVGWALIQQDRCEEGTRVLRAVLAESSGAVGAQGGIDACAERERIHGSIWASLGASLYQGHPWMHESGAGSIGFDLQPGGNLEFGGLYRFLALKATDARVPGFTQHEAYAQLGYVSPNLDILGHGALVWSGDAVVGGSRHVGLSLRRKYGGTFAGDVFIEVSGSYYQDLWVVRIAPAWTLDLSPVALTASVAVERFAHEILGGASLTATLTLGSLSFWLNAKAGPEYRAPYLSQFGVFNAEDRSDWGASAGARWRADEHWALFVGYTLLRLRTSDGLLSELHNVNIGTVFTL